MTDPGLGLNIILPEGKEFYVGSAPFHRSLPANGILNPKCGSEVANSGQTNSSPSPSPVPKPRGNVVYLCVDQVGKKTMTDTPLPGMDCKAY